MAFHQKIDFRPLVAGYSVCILFWNISSMSLGIGVVEGVMALVYSSQGIHGFIGKLILLAFRALNFWRPRLLGFILLRRVEILKPKQRD